jgi:lipid A 3-O-deacylase
MPERHVLGALAAALIVAASAPVHGEPVSFALSTGQYGLRKEIPHALALEMEVGLPWRWTLLRPVAGLLATSGGAAFVYSGVAIEIPLPGRLRLTPGFAPGVLAARGDGDLGSRVEFRSSVELSIAPAEAVRIGVGFSHISNAHLGDHNPGVEVITARIAVPAGE